MVSNPLEHRYYPGHRFLCTSFNFKVRKTFLVELPQYYIYVKAVCSLQMFSSQMGERWTWTAAYRMNRFRHFIRLKPTTEFEHLFWLVFFAAQKCVCQLNFCVRFCSVFVDPRIQEISYMWIMEQMDLNITLEFRWVRLKSRYLMVLRLWIWLKGYVMFFFCSGGAELLFNKIKSREVVLDGNKIRKF